MKILNLYAGIGGNRKLWGDDHEVTAVENNPKVAGVYKELFPNDKIIIGDAHKYLLDHYKEFDFIWSSPPCPTHSRLRKGMIDTKRGGKPVYPDMRLYEEIIFLKHYFKGKWVVENVIGYYEPLIKPFKISRHYYWSNVVLDKIKTKVARFTLTTGLDKEAGRETRKEQVARLEKELGFDLSNHKIDKKLALRNCVEPNVALHIFNMAFKNKQETLFG